VTSSVSAAKLYGRLSFRRLAVEFGLSWGGGDSAVRTGRARCAQEPSCPLAKVLHSDPRAGGARFADFHHSHWPGPWWMPS